MREHILRTAERLTVERGDVPSLNVLAAAAGVSKGGLTHHFPSRAALVDGLVRDALESVDEVMTDAAARGDVAETWIRVAIPSARQAEMFRVLTTAHRALAADSAVLVEASQAIARWEALIADEVGDRMHARVIRLVGDGLMFNAIAGLEDPALTEVDALITAMIGPSRA